jgi:hypothetical protein
MRYVQRGNVTLLLSFFRVVLRRLVSSYPQWMNDFVYCVSVQVTLSNPQLLSAACLNYLSSDRDGTMLSSFFNEANIIIQSEVGGHLFGLVPGECFPGIIACSKRFAPNARYVLRVLSFVNC